jgi:hypothetical protein
MHPRGGRALCVGLDAAKTEERTAAYTKGLRQLEEGVRRERARATSVGLSHGGGGEAGGGGGGGAGGAGVGGIAQFQPVLMDHLREDCNTRLMLLSIKRSAVLGGGGGAGAGGAGVSGGGGAASMAAAASSAPALPGGAGGVDAAEGQGRRKRDSDSVHAALRADGTR